jgi:putative ABC transport system ATP-binding protein
MIRATNINKSFNNEGVETHALHNLNFSIEQGECISITGPSGSGKSSLMNILGLLITPTSGELEMWGQQAGELSDKQRLALRRGNIGYLYSDPYLINDLSVAENIALPLEYMNFSKKERMIKTNAVLERFRLTHKKNFSPAQLGEEQKQIVSIARAMVISPRLIIADEPTGKLNSKDADTILWWLDQINESGVTILHATHSGTIASKCDRIIQLFDGHIVS